MLISKEVKNEILNSISNQESFIKGSVTGRTPNSPYKKIDIKPVLIKEKYRLQFAMYDERKVYHKNLQLDEAQSQIELFIQEGFANVILKTTEGDIHLICTPKKIKIKKSSATIKQAADLSHDREKNHFISRDKFYPFLYRLGIQDKDGKIINSMSDKFTQLNKFLEIIDNEIKKQNFSELTVIDYGCGKAYLTFALYHYLTSLKKIKAKVIGVDFNKELVNFSNETAKKVGFNNLSFKYSTIAEFQQKGESPDIVLSLHACNTATDDILAKAIQTGTKMIFSAPCCQQEFFKKINPSEKALKDSLSFGLVKERTCALLTDTYRSLLLQSHGYKTSMTEFIDGEHTGKNIMITAIKTKGGQTPKTEKNLNDFKEAWGLKNLYLDSILK
ncbi:MAG: SAM-dependent methyltransferase [Alphaproteobacteria bacterium]|jgi:SAM-dependent methyltransferase|nr:SAM-dependent methyltransferase [Alphaproteobacteria bacterium]